MEHMERMEWTKLLSGERLSQGKFQENEELGLSPFERDYYTIVTSSYFRRLQKKTQVYVLDKKDFSRTRLTHSLEVSAIAEILGKRVGQRVREIESARGNKLWDGFEDDLALVLRCSGLLHDLGNPPFGHSGEEYIRRYFEDREGVLRKGLPDQMWLDLISFEGNAQNLRIVTKLGQSSNPDVENYGMNLTSAVINSLVKYPISSLERKAQNEKSHKNQRGKIGYYHSEDWIMRMVADRTGTRCGQRYFKDPVMFLMEAADDIAYATADIEDAVKKRILDEREVDRKLRTIFPQYYEKDIPSTLKNVRQQSMAEVVEVFVENYEAIMSGTCDDEFDLIKGCQCNVGELKTMMSAQGIYKKRNEYAETTLNTDSKVSDLLDLLIKAITKEQKTFTDHIILQEMDQYIKKGKREVEHLLYYAKKHEDKEEPELEQIREIEGLYHKYQAVIDFVSGMTDSYVGIFLDQVSDNENILEAKRKYKENCLRRLMDIDSSDESDASEIEEEVKTAAQAKAQEIGELFEDISHVDCWEDYEIAVILRYCLSNNLIGKNGQTEEGRNKYHAVMAELFAQLSEEKSEKLLTEAERKELREKPIG